MQLLGGDGMNLPMTNNQLNKCPICKIHPVLVMFHTIWVCGACVERLVKREQERNNQWIQEFIDEKKD